MWLTNLDPEIQEAILFLPRAESGPDTFKEIDLRRIAQVMDWGVQREMWLASGRNIASVTLIEPNLFYPSR